MWTHARVVLGVFRIVYIVTHIPIICSNYCIVQIWNVKFLILMKIIIRHINDSTAFCSWPSLPPGQVYSILTFFTTAGVVKITSGSLAGSSSSFNAIASAIFPRSGSSVEPKLRSNASST